MPDPEPGGDGIRDVSVLDHENEAACRIFGRFEEAGELFVRLVADRALRAMLKN